MDLPTQAEIEREINREQIAEYRLMDNEFMQAFFHENIPCTQKMVRVILSRTDVKVISSNGEYHMPNLRGHSVILDVHAIDERGREFGFEVQRADEGAKPKRARYDSSLMDANYPNPGKYAKNLPEIWTVFIVEHDVLGLGLPSYIIERTITGKGRNKLFGDGSHIIYVNVSIQDDTPLGRLAHDFTCKDPNEMYDRDFAERARYLKETERGVETMTKRMEERIEKVREETRRETVREFARNMIEDNEPFDKVVKYSRLSLDEVQKLAGKSLV